MGAGLYDGGTTKSHRGSIEKIPGQLDLKRIVGPVMNERRARMCRRIAPNLEGSYHCVRLSSWRCRGVQISKNKHTCGAPYSRKRSEASSKSSSVPSVTESRRFFFHERRNVPGILVLNTLHTRSARTDQQRRVALFPRVDDAEKLNGAIGVESFSGSRTIRFLVPVSAPLFRLTADQFDWQVRPMAGQQEIA